MINGRKGPKSPISTPAAVMLPQIYRAFEHAHLQFKKVFLIPKPPKPIKCLTYHAMHATETTPGAHGSSGCIYRKWAATKQSRHRKEWGQKKEGELNLQLCNFWTACGVWTTQCHLEEERTREGDFMEAFWMQLGWKSQAFVCSNGLRGASSQTMTFLLQRGADPHMGRSRCDALFVAMYTWVSPHVYAGISCRGKTLGHKVKNTFIDDSIPSLSLLAGVILGDFLIAPGTMENYHKT